MCDLLSVMPCHVILGRTLFWDCGAQHAALANTCSFVKGNTKHTLVLQTCQI